MYSFYCTVANSLSLNKQSQPRQMNEKTQAIQTFFSVHFFSMAEREKNWPQNQTHNQQPVDSLLYIE